MSQLTLRRASAIVVPLILGEILFGLGFAILSFQFALHGELHTRAVIGLLFGSALLGVAHHANPSRHPPLYSLYLRPLALGCFLTVAATLRRFLEGEAVSRTVSVAALVAFALAIGAILFLRRINTRGSKAAA